MLPIIFNENPSRLVQLTMSGSVGTGGHNDRADTKFVQLLLNAIPLSQGGPETKLAVDGLVGPKTIAAIQRYQKANTLFCDGRVDMGGPTIRSLISWLNERSMLPTGVSNLTPPRPEWIRCLSGKAAPIPRPKLFQGANSALPATSLNAKSLAVSSGPLSGGLYTGWDFNTSSGLSVSIVLSATFINIYLKHDTEPYVQYRLTFTGIGTGLSKFPVGLDFSTADMNSYGTSIYYGANPLSKPRPFNVNAFVGLPTWIMSVGVNTLGGKGWGGALVAYGCVVPILDDPQYVGALTGAQWGSVNAGISLYVGTITGWV